VSQQGVSALVERAQRFPRPNLYFSPQGKHKTWDCDQLQDFAYEVLMTAKKAHQEKKLEDPKGNFHEAHKEVN
jgi:hypothetical protein